MNRISLIVVTALVVIVAYFYPTLQHLVSIGGGYTSKSVCAGVFLSKRKVHTIKENEMSGISALLFAPVVDQEKLSVTTTLLGIPPSIGKIIGLTSPTAIYLGPHFGCQLQIPNDAQPAGGVSSTVHDFEKLRLEDELFRTDLKTQGHPKSKLIKSTATTNACMQRVIDKQLSEEAFKQNQTRAAVVARSDGSILAEGYQTEFLGITDETKLLGWSMTKSVFAMIIGAGIQQDLLTLDTPLKLHALTKAHREKVIRRNGGKALTFGDLLHMSDVLHIAEDYNMFQNIVKMLYSTHDGVLHAAGGEHIDEFGVGTARPLPPPPSDKAAFAWYYSSAVSNLLSYEFRALFKSDRDYWAFPYEHLFSKIGADSFAIELDPSGTIVASSFAYGTGQDWAKLGVLLLNKGLWTPLGEDGNSAEPLRVLPEDFVSQIQVPHPASAGHYGGQFWLNPARVGLQEYAVLPYNHDRKRITEWMITALPADAYYMSGHEGQFVFIIPSLDLVITRLGFTRDGRSVPITVDDGDGKLIKSTKPVWEAKEFFGEIVKCVR